MCPLTRGVACVFVSSMRCLSQSMTRCEHAIVRDDDVTEMYCAALLLVESGVGVGEGEVGACVCFTLHGPSKCFRVFRKGQ